MMQDWNSCSVDQTDGCFQKPMRRALGELTNSPRLLDHHLSPRFQSPKQSTPPKQPEKQSPAITPTHNLKLLTELAAKVAGGSSSARQTLQFEDIDTTRYTSEPVFIGSSPHRDHTYGNKNVLCASYEPKDEFCDDYVKLEPTVTAEEARIETGFQPRIKLHKGAGKSDVRPSLPPLPQEAALFMAPTERGNRKDKSLGLLAGRMLQIYPYELSKGDYAEVHLDDTASKLNTERRRIYDIVNVFEAVQIMSKVGKNVYNWHGRTYLMHSLAWLRQLGVKLGMQEQYRLAKEQERDMNDIENLSPLQSPRLNSPAMSPMMSPYGSPGLSPYGSPNDPNGTSMGINTQKFLMLFLVMPQPTKLTLEFAARVIHGPNPNDKAKVTRVRRLYDIANILQALGLIRKVQIPEGKGKKPAFEYVGPPVDNIELTDEQKRSMPSTRQKNSLLAVGKNLAQLPDEANDCRRMLGATAKRTRSLSGERHIEEDKIVRARSVGREGDGLVNSGLLELGEVCEREREKIQDVQYTPTTMKPPTPGRPPSRKKVLLQRYYSDSALHSFVSPNPVNSPPLHSPRPLYSPRAVPFPSPLALKSSPLTSQPLSPKQPRTIRSPVTPRDLRNAAILPPSSPVNKCRVPCSPMGPVGRSLLASPASPRSPIDLSVRPSRHGRSPLASRSLNLPPSPVTSSDASNSPKPLQPISKQCEPTSTLLRAYLANNKSRIFKPIPPGGSNRENVTVIGLLSDTTPPPTPRGGTAPCSISGPSPDGTTNSSSTSELDGIFSRSQTATKLQMCSDTSSSQVYMSKSESCVRLPSIDTPMDFSCLLREESASSKAFRTTPTVVRGGSNLVTPTFLTSPYENSQN